MQRPKPLILVILDGWGLAQASPDNAISLAATPNWNGFVREFPHGTINASELEVGLPAGQMGNSEVGHMNIGAGRVVMQDLPRIDATIAGGSLANNPQLQAFIATLKKTGGTCHLLGLLSPGGVHAHMNHIAALAKIVASCKLQVAVHAFLDGRDTPPKSALDYLATCNLQLATISGRYYAMDRDKRWDRVQKAYDTIVDSKGERFQSAAKAIEASYAANKTDEFVLPCVIGDYNGMKDGDGLLMANFRADRARQLLTALLDEGFDGFPRNHSVKFAAALGMVEYSAALAPLIPALFPPESLHDIFGEVVSKAGLTQLRIAETEKYAHVTFFFNGGREAEFPGESRILIPSPKVATYDLKPEMAAAELTEALLAAIAERKYDVIIVNYANADMVGHTGNVQASIKAVETVDACLGMLAETTLAAGGALFITADHGNIESLFDHNTNQPHTAHTLNVVPAVLVAETYRGSGMRLRDGKLADIAPTLLALLGLPKPAAMTGRSLLPDA